MNSPPAFQFYAADWLADADVTMMTLEEEGAYIRALAFCWREGSIPADEKRLSVLLKGGSREVLSSVKQRFKISPSDPQRLVHGRLDLERQKQKEWRVKSSEAGKKTGKVRREKKLNNEPTLNSGLGLVKPKVNSSSSSSSSSIPIKKEQKQKPTVEATPQTEGERVKQTKTALIKSRHDAFKEAIKKYWAVKNPDVEMPWGPAEGKTLAIWLKESPTTTLEQFIAWLRNRFKSEVNHTDRPSKWIRNVTMFASGPIDRFGKPLSLKNMNGGHHAAVPSGTGNQIVGVLERTLAGRQRNRALSEDGDLPTSGEVRRNDIEPVHGVFAPVGPSSLPSGHEEPSAKPKAGGGDGLPYPW